MITTSTQELGRSSLASPGPWPITQLDQSQDPGWLAGWMIGGLLAGWIQDAEFCVFTALAGWLASARMTVDASRLSPTDSAGWPTLAVMLAIPSHRENSGPDGPGLWPTRDRVYI